MDKEREPREGGAQKPFRPNRKRKKVCQFCAEKIDHIDYKDTARLRKHISERAKILPPQSLMGPADEGRVEKLIVADEFDLKYLENLDRESAYEILARATEELALQRQREEEEADYGDTIK